MDYFSLIKQKPELFRNDKRIFGILTNSQVIKRWVDKKNNSLREKGLPKAWGDIGVILDDPYIVVIRDLIKFPNGHAGGYLRLINKSELQGGTSVVILPEYRDKLVLQLIFRHPQREWSWEIPRGFGEPNLSAEHNVRKEIREEIQGEISHLCDLGIYYSNTGLDGNKINLFYAKLKSVGKANINEGIKKIRYVTVSKFEKMIRESEIKDGFTIAAYARAKLRELI